MLRAKRPPVTWSIVVACLAAMIGWMVGTCEVAKTPVLRRGADGRRPGEALEAGPVEIGRAAEAMPAPDRHQRLELHLVGAAGQLQRVRPVDLQHAVDARDGAAAPRLVQKVPSLSLRSLNSGLVLRRDSSSWVLSSMAVPCAKEPKLTNGPARWQSAHASVI